MSFIFFLSEIISYTYSFLETVDRLTVLIATLQIPNTIIYGKNESTFDLNYVLDIIYMKHGSYQMWVCKCIITQRNEFVKCW